jgi:uncharacterized protein YozE (UPF0346 family)
MAMTQRVKATKNSVVIIADDRFADLRLPKATSSGQLAVDVATLRQAEWILQR